MIKKPKIKVILTKKMSFGCYTDIKIIGEIYYNNSILKITELLKGYANIYFGKEFIDYRIGYEDHKYFAVKLYPYNSEKIYYEFIKQ